MRRFAHAERRGLLISGIVAVLGVAVYALLYRAAFPTIAPRRMVTRDEAVRICRKDLRLMGCNLSGWDYKVHLCGDRAGSEYLQRNLGIRRTEELVNNGIPIWQWHITWFKPSGGGESDALIGIDGRPIRLQAWGLQTKPRSTPRSHRVSRRAALRKALAFVRSVGVDASRYRLQPEEKGASKSDRRTHKFYWQEKGLGLTAGCASFAESGMYVTVKGNGVSEFSRGLSEELYGDPTAESKLNDRLVGVSLYAMWGIGALALIIIIANARTRALRVRFAVLLAIAAGCLLVAAGLLDWPAVQIRSYGVQTGGRQFVAHALEVLKSAVCAMGVVLLAAAAGDVMQRKAFPRMVPISRMFTREGLRSREFLTAVTVGLGLAGAHLAFVTVFYAVTERRCGVWMPAHLLYCDGASTALSWLCIPATAFGVALREEFIFRVLAISALRRCLKLTWLAVTIPAVVWALGHCDCGQRPGYIRAVEVSAIGVAYGMVYLRYGVVSTVMAHCAVNAVVDSTYLLMSGDPRLRASGLAVVCVLLLPFTFSLAANLRNPAYRLSDELPAERNDEPTETDESLAAADIAQ